MTTETKKNAPSRVVMTGSGGFLGWHTRAALAETGTPIDSVKLGRAFDPQEAAHAVSGTDRLIHIAGVNRAPDSEVVEGNVAFAEQLAEAIRSAVEPPPMIVYANSTQAGNGTPYGLGKEMAAEVLAAAAEAVGAEFVDVRLPNLFGEHGRPFYNAVTATFCHVLAVGGSPTVENDKELTLLHAQNAADLLTGVALPDALDSLTVRESVSGLLERLATHAVTYRRGEIPDVADAFERDLFNTYRSYVIDSQTPIRLTRHADARGSFFEIIRSHGGSGQSSFSTTAPGISRGDHFHRRKVERFTVLAGEARISLRKLFSRDVFHIDVTGDAPMAIDMPTMWAHKITNTGSAELYTSFWTNDLFDPTKPDTISEAVE